MEALNDFMNYLEKYLNAEPIMRRRIEHIKSSIEDGKALVELTIQGKEPFTVELKERRFRIRSGPARVPLLSWSVPMNLLKQVLLGKAKILYTLRDPACTLSFDTPNFTHWNGITALAVILMAQELVKKDPVMKQLVENI